METPATATSRPPAGVQKRRKPSGETSHVCPFCGRAFKRSEHKERHVRTHTKEKPFVCHCGSAFTRRDLLTRHQRIATHEKLQDAHDTKTEHNAVPPTIETGADLNPAISPSDVSVNSWEQHGNLDSFYHATGIAPDDHQMLNHQIQQPILPQDYYQGQELPAGYGDFESFSHFDDSGLPIGWNANSYFQPPGADDHVDPQLQDTISISI
ncbi:hypothetical protein SCUP234_00993 [Seiridium cupressi]